MKNIFTLMLIASLGMMLSFTSCEKDDDRTSDPLQTVNVSGHVTAEMDLTNTSREAVPSGNKIVFRIDSRDLVQNPISGYDYRILQYETTIQSGGFYSIDLPAVIFQAVGVEIVPVDFKSTYKESETVSTEKVYTGAASTISIQQGERYFKDLMYN